MQPGTGSSRDLEVSFPPAGRRSRSCESHVGAVRDLGCVVSPRALSRGSAAGSPLGSSRGSPRGKSESRSCGLPWPLEGASSQEWQPQVDDGADFSELPDSDPDIQDYSAATQGMEREMAACVSASAMDLPASIFGAAMALSMEAYYHSITGDTFVVIQAVVTYFACLAGIGAQWFILVTVRLYLMRPAVLKVRDIYHTYHREFVDQLTGEIDLLRFEGADKDFQRQLCEMPLANSSFCFIILAVWSGCITTDLLETIKYMYAWFSLEAAQDGKPIATFEGRERRLVIKRCSEKMKALIFVTILIPKMIISTFCWWIGCRWLIATTSYQEFLLNSVALAFVLDIDEMIYYCSLTRSTQRWVESHCVTLPYAAHHVTSDSVMYRKRRIGFNLVHMTIAWTFMVGAPIMYMSRQQMLPDYEWDVAGPCAKYYSEIFTGLDAMHNLMNMRFGD